MSLVWDIPVVMADMQVGDSFFIPCVDCPPLRAKIAKLAALGGLKVSIRFCVEGDIQGLRTWREPM